VNYRLERTERLILLRWQLKPGLAELNAVGDQLEAWLRAEPNQLGLMVILSPSLQVPGGNERSVLEKRLGGLFPSLAWMALVVEGEGLVVESKRLFVRAISILTRARFQVFRSVAEAVASAPSSLGEPARLQAAAQSA
jgi:hypothetical protein